MSDIFKKLPTTKDEIAVAHALAFLSYEEKILAGSWRFLTYFGRDTLLSLYLLRPALGPAMLEAALASVLERLAANGSVAHEEEIGDWAAYRRLINGQTVTAGAGAVGPAAAPVPAATPIYDYKMVDADFLLPTFAAAYLLDPEQNPVRLQAFLSRKTSAGVTFKDALLTNMRLVLALAHPYAASPLYTNLIRLRDGQSVGDWRDSADGLGGGVYPYSVNVAFVPAALAAIVRLAQSDWFKDGVEAAAGQAERMRQVWQLSGRHFQVSVRRDEAHAALQAYQRSLGLGEPEADLPAEDPHFHALSLTQKGETVGVMHSDQGFSMLFDEPLPSDLLQAVRAILQPFPLGLLTPVGLVVANPVFSDEGSMWGRFTRNHYHGTVVWSWQQAVYLMGLRRQALRRDLPETLRAELNGAADALARIIAKAPSHGREELWTFRINNGVYEESPFGADRADQTESNPVQLWSTVFYGKSGL